MTDHHCLVCGRLATHHIDPVDDLFAVPKTFLIHGCHISAALEDARIAELVDWQLSESPAAQREQKRQVDVYVGRWPD